MDDPRFAMQQMAALLAQGNSARPPDRRPVLFGGNPNANPGVRNAMDLPIQMGTTVPAPPGSSIQPRPQPLDRRPFQFGNFSLESRRQNGGRAPQDLGVASGSSMDVPRDGRGRPIPDPTGLGWW